MKIEYAITAGEGTLLDYGVWWASAAVDKDGVYMTALSWGSELLTYEEYPGATLIARPCSGDCETGK
jgi:hypothetical protein